MQADWTLRIGWTLAIGLWLSIVVHWFSHNDATVDLAADEADAQHAAVLPNIDSDKPGPLFSVARERAPQPVAVVPVAAEDTRGVCGWGEWPDAPREIERVKAEMEQQRAAAWPRLVAALRARGGPSAEAEAVALESLGARERGNRTLADVSDLACRNGDDCVDKHRSLAQAVYAQAPASSDRLIELASSSNDPWTVWLGVRECDARLQAPNGCAALTWRRLAALDADNGAMWLELAAHDAGAVDEAIYQAARAQRFDSYSGRLAAAVESILPADLPPLQRTAAWLVIAHEELLGPISGLQIAARHCGEANLRDANRAQLCESLARRMVEQGRDYQVAGIGYGIGAKLGWPAGPRQAMRDEHAALAEAMRADFQHGDMSCRAVAASTRWAREMARDGERLAAKRLIERSGVSQPELLRRAEARQRQVVAAASAASSVMAVATP
jgi:hypothetical protein